MEWNELDYLDLLRDLNRQGAHYLVIGRRAIAALGGPVHTHDIDLFLSPERRDLDAFLEVGRKHDLEGSSTPPETVSGFIRLFADNTHVDCFRARAYRTQDGEDIFFDAMYERRQTALVGDVEVPLPDIDDLMRTKRLRPTTSPKAAGDALDLVYLAALKERLLGGGSPSR